MLSYLLQMILCSGVLYAYYYLFLRNEHFHQYNRFYLLFSVVLSLVLPLLEVPVYIASDSGSGVPGGLAAYTDYVLPEVVVSAKATSGFTIWKVLLAIYLLITLFMLGRVIAAVAELYQRFHKAEKQHYGGLALVSANLSNAPFSFFRWLFWNPALRLDSEEGQRIFRHEYYHARQYHSLDNVFLAVVNALCWFNPVFRFIKKDLDAVHEFLADRYASQGESISGYATLLLTQSFDARSAKQFLETSFFHTQLKRRIAMLHHRYTPGHPQYVKKILTSLAVVAISATFIVSCKTEGSKDKEGQPAETVAANEIVKDAPPIMPDSSAASVNNPANARETETVQFTPPKIVRDDAKAKEGKTSPNVKAVEFTPPKIVHDNAEAKEGKTSSNDKETVQFTPPKIKLGLEPEIFTKVEQDAAYPGGPEAWRDFLGQNLRGDVPVNNHAPAGTYMVMVQFIVDREGNLSDVKALTKNGYGMEEEAVRAVKNSGKWLPAQQNKRTVKAYRKQPITFLVTEG
ncbi:MAG: M56 family metallopeptidase [Niabella sp.]